MQKLVEATPALSEIITRAAGIRRNLVPENTSGTSTVQNSISTRNGQFILSFVSRNGTEYLHAETYVNGAAAGFAGTVRISTHEYTVPVLETPIAAENLPSFTYVYLKITYNSVNLSISAELEQNTDPLFGSAEFDRFTLARFYAGRLEQFWDSAPGKPIDIYYRMV